MSTALDKMQEAFKETEGLTEDEVIELVETGSVTIERMIANPEYDAEDNPDVDEEMTVKFELTLTVVEGK